MVNYEGIFFEHENMALINSLESNKLPIVNDEIHCTFKYHPEEQELFDELVGTEVKIDLISYANNGQNSGFGISIPEEYQKYYINYDEDKPDKLKIPHITASLAEGAKASKTKDLDFIPLEKPVKVTGKFGYWIKEEDGTEYLSYEPYLKKYTK